MSVKSVVMESEKEDDAGEVSDLIKCIISLLVVKKQEKQLLAYN